MTTKAQRQQAIARIIATHHVSSQPELQKMLRAQKIEATQATVSRDLEELGAVKVRVSGKDSRYAIPEFEPARIAPTDQLRRVLTEWVAEVSASGPMVVVRTPPGCAHVVASALDRSGMEGLMGTVAGDDTILCVASEKLGGRALAQRLRELAGQATSSKASSQSKSSQSKSTQSKSPQRKKK